MATTQEQNERLTQVGAGTPMGKLLRRYWQPIGTVAELDTEPVRKVRLLGEDLVLFRTENGDYGLMDELCPHRGMDMQYGIPCEHSLRCAYHGWAYDLQGRCIEQPFEEYTNPQARFKDKVTIKAYPAQELGGLVFAYLGPEPAPLLPRWDALVREDVDAVVDVHELPCNWLQTMDNAADPVHFTYLHAAFGNYQLQKLGRPAAMFPARHLKIDFDVFKYGIMKRRLLEGESEDSDDWKIGHPLIFPNLLAVGETHRPMLQYRVPVDDTTTIQFAYRTLQREQGAEPKPIAVHRGQLFNQQGKVIADNVPAQDMLAWVAQGPISQRTREHLGASDRGVILFHKMLFEQMDIVEEGGDPMGVIRDPAENEPMVDLNRERVGYQPFKIEYEEYFDQVRGLATSLGR
jgi:5,5'-dehydrodivanillate O-demethylase oxygenase subunit